MIRNEAREQSLHIVQAESARIFAQLDASRQPLGDVAEKRTGTAYKAEDFCETGNVPVVKLKEIETKAPTVFLRNPVDYTNVWIEKGDILLAKTSFSTGAMCMWPGTRAVLNQNAVMLRAKPHMDQEYLFVWLGFQVHQYLADHLADPKFYPYIREADLIKWLVPVPPLAEQRRIVAELNALQTQADALQKLQTETAAGLDALLPSILDKAFKGEL
jgi:type I restriction enzyme, S subunit